MAKIAPEYIHEFLGKKFNKDFGMWNTPKDARCTMQDAGLPAGSNNRELCTENRASNKAPAKRQSDSELQNPTMSYAFGMTPIYLPHAFGSLSGRKPVGIPKACRRNGGG